MIIATRNRLVQGYLGIDDDIPWSIATDDGHHWNVALCLLGLVQSAGDVQ